VSLYYLVASLPHLAFGERPPFSSERFRFLLRGLLDPSQERDLDLVLAARPGGEDPFVDEWAEAGDVVQRAQAALRLARACKRGGDCGTPPLPAHAAARRIEAAYELSSPLETEQAVDRIRWSLLDELTLNRHFEFRQVLAYAVRLAMLERWAALTDEAGQARIETLTDEAAAAAGLPTRAADTLGTARTEA